ncbi:MAG: divalent-cation tolerance protein CutA [Thermoguttaceae bacterium]|jgi:periplasmic divalent cation tolerance protein
MTNPIQVFTTTARKEEAQQIAVTLVEERLAACVQVLGPITSTYRWQDAIETSEEWLCLIKSRQDLYPQLEEAICRIHPYEVPEILAVPVVAGSPSYLAWLQEQTGSKDVGPDDLGQDFPL